MISAAPSTLPAAQDSAIRYAIPAALSNLDPDRHQVVEASAGTGKTYLIEHRVLDLLLSTDCLIEQILVVTFTEKATAELRFRVRRLIETVLAHKQHNADPDEPHWRIDDDARRRLRDALLGFDRAAIFTIHAFCQRVLTENAFANRRLFAQTQVASEEVFGDTFKGALRELFARDADYKPYLEAWCRTGRSVEDLENLLYRCASQNGELTPDFDPERLALTLDRLAFRLPRLRDVDALAGTLRTAGIRAQTAKAMAPRLIAIRELLDDWIDKRHIPTFIADYDTLQKTYKSGKKRLITYLVHGLNSDKVIAAAPELAPIREVVIDLAQAVISLAATVAHVFLPAVTERLEEHKSRRGQFDFQDMLHLVWDSMEGDGGDELIERLRQRYRYALIDEFQDTDEVQWKIFRALYLDPADIQPNPDITRSDIDRLDVSRASDGGEQLQEQNRLCIIGDPKQAIYGFRGADVYMYLQARREVCDHGGQSTNLIENYRSTDLLVRAYNTIFEERFGLSFFTGDIRYDHPVRAATDLVAIDAKGAPVVPIHVFQVTPPTEPRPSPLNADRLRQTLLVRMTAEIRALLYDDGSAIRVGSPGNEKSVRAGDIFILTRTTGESNDVAAILRQAGLPCAIYKQEGLFQTREAREVLDLLAGIAEPRDRSARFHAWNTRFFGVTLSDLPHLSALPENHALCARLYEWKALADKLSYEQLFARIVDDSGIIERELFLETSERSLTNFLHIFELLLEEVMRSRCELHELTQRLARWIDETAKLQSDERNIQRLESEDSAVQIMTIHRAKGLEAKVVFLYGGFGGFSGDEVQVYHTPDGQRLVHVGYPGEEIAGAVVRENESEDQRLLYVALTRAVARLYLPHVDKSDYNKVRGCYKQIEKRLEPIVKQVQAGDEQLSALFHVERVSSNSRAIDQMSKRRMRLEEWEPPQGLLDAGQHRDDYADISRARRGFAVTSYTSMKSQGGSRVPLAAIDFKADIAAVSARLPDEQLPGGAQSGVFLHYVLEYLPLASLSEAIDFDDWRALPEIDRLFRSAMLRFNRDPRHLEYSQRVIYHSVTTPIGIGRQVVPSLATCKRIMREVEFLYPIPTSQTKRAELGLLAERDSIRLERGYVKGFIDLCFEYRGRVYMVDWKSDILPDYSGPTMSKHVYHEYRVQAELYTVALSKMLDIDSESKHRRRFGGLLFCFIRGIGSAAVSMINRDKDDTSGGKQPGVFYIRHPLSRLRELERALEQRDDYR